MFKVYEVTAATFELLLNTKGYKLVTFVATTSGTIAAVFEVDEPAPEGDDRDKSN